MTCRSTAGARLAPTAPRRTPIGQPTSVRRTRLKRSLAPNAARRVATSRATTARRRRRRRVEQDVGRQQAAPQRDVHAVAGHRIDEARRHHRRAAGQARPTARASTASGPSVTTRRDLPRVRAPIAQERVAPHRSHNRAPGSAIRSRDDVTRHRLARPVRGGRDADVVAGAHVHLAERAQSVDALGICANGPAARPHADGAMRPSAIASGDRRPSAAIVQRAAMRLVAAARAVARARPRPGHRRPRSGAWTRTDVRTSTPARAAASSSCVSRCRRAHARPTRPSPYVPRMQTPVAPVTSMPSSGRPCASIGPASPADRSSATPPGLSVSPHSLCRGNVSRSQQHHARAAARQREWRPSAPAGTAARDDRRQVPRVASSLRASHHDSAVLRSESQAVAQRRLDLSTARPWLGSTSMSHAGSRCVTLIVGGRNPRSMASAVVTMPHAPLAPCG